MGIKGEGEEEMMFGVVVSRWRRIDSAPKEGGPLVLVWVEEYSRPTVAYWSTRRESWINFAGAGEKIEDTVTHWMPLLSGPRRER